MTATIFHHIAKAGKNNPHAKLTEEQVREIRKFGELDSQLPYGWKAKLARGYGVAPSQITRILQRRTWGDLPAPANTTAARKE